MPDTQPLATDGLQGRDTHYDASSTGFAGNKLFRYRN